MKLFSLKIKPQPIHKININIFSCEVLYHLYSVPVTLYMYDIHIQFDYRSPLLVSTPATKPTWNELIEVKHWKNFRQRSIAAAIALHTPDQCASFANLLLNDHLYVNATRRRNPETEAFVGVVLDKWYSSVGGPASPCTWRDLIRCMEGAGLDKEMIQAITDNVHVS